MFDAVESIVMQVTADEEKRVAVPSPPATRQDGAQASTWSWRRHTMPVSTMSLCARLRQSS